jgi:hypothetical protein
LVPTAVNCSGSSFTAAAGIGDAAASAVRLRAAVCEPDVFLWQLLLLLLLSGN